MWHIKVISKSVKQDHQMKLLNNHFQTIKDLIKIINKIFR